MPVNGECVEKWSQDAYHVATIIVMTEDSVLVAVLRLPVLVHYQHKS
jgi:hypothetical protein